MLSTPQKVSKHSIPDRFKEAIQLHLIRNIWNATRDTTALIMGIEGPPGEGKSYQCRKVLDELGYKYIELSTSDFGSRWEAEAARTLGATYVEASVLAQTTRIPHAIICDDVDAAIGQWSERTQYTVNRQLLSGELMHLAENPTRLRVDATKLSDTAKKLLDIKERYDGELSEAKTTRVPFFMTGNDFTKLYSPLLRDGRMTRFAWLPSPEEKQAVVAKIMRLNASDAQNLIALCEELAKKHNVNVPSVSFYTALRNRAFDDIILSTLKSKGWKDGMLVFNQQIVAPQINEPTFNDYCSKAEDAVIQSLTHQSYLEEV